MITKRIRQFADDDYESLGTLFRLRAPVLGTGLAIGVSISFLTSRFEQVILQNVHVAFFLPFIVYIAAAVGTQTEAIYARDLRNGHAKFRNYLKKEFLLGILFGVTFGLISWAIVWIWLQDRLLAQAVGLAACLAVASAPIVGLLVTQVFELFRKDPAVGAGPLATVLQDLTSILIYGIVATVILL